MTNYLSALAVVSRRAMHLLPLGERLLRRIAPISRLSGTLVLVLAAFMALPLLLAWWQSGQDLRGFFYAELVCLCLGVALVGIGMLRPFVMHGREIFLFTTFSWLLISTLSALPLRWSSLQLSWADAWFESVSGVTTTGATVIVGLQDLSHALLLWRGLIQWIGGIGIIVVGMAILPFLQVGGMRLFQSESSDKSEKVLPRSTEVAKAIGKIYLVMTVLYILIYWLAGMKGFDALVHGLTTVATGGFANYDESFGIYHDRPWILWLSSLFMFAAALPFALYVKSWQGKRLVLWQDSQVRTFFWLLLIAALILSSYLYLQHGDLWFAALTQAVFNVVSVTTTTGYAAADYNAWGAAAIIVFFYLTFLGGCSGSTSGGFKIFRLQLSFDLIGNQLRTLVHPRGVFVQRYNGRVVPPDILRSMVAFAMLYFATIAFLALILSWLGLDPLTSLSGAATAVGNVGPGLGEIIGPAGNFSSLPEAAKWALAGGMLLGRLEIVTVMILLSPTYWRR